MSRHRDSDLGDLVQLAEQAGFVLYSRANTEVGFIKLELI